MIFNKEKNFSNFSQYLKISTILFFRLKINLIDKGTKFLKLFYLIENNVEIL